MNNNYKIEFISPQRSMNKRWSTAQRLKSGQIDHVQNNLVEHYYHQILNLAKTSIASLPNPNFRTVFDKDYKQDNTENCFTMHCFITPNFYWYLECNFAYRYSVEFDFFNCPFEADVKTAIAKRYMLSRNCKQKTLEPNVYGYYQRVLEAQGKQYFYSL